MDLSLNLENTHVLVTGGSGYISTAVVDAFLSAGASVTSLDLKPHTPRPASGKFQYLQCDIADEASLVEVFAEAVKSFGLVQCCIALASLDLSALEHHENGVLQANYSKDNISLIIVGSESGRFGERRNADYATGKSAVQGGLVSSLMGDVIKIWPRAKANAVAPGPVDTVQFRRHCAQNPNQLWLDAQATTPMKMPVPPEAVAKSILFLASESWSGNITWQTLCDDSGKQGKVFGPKEEC